jgi:solute carrier family 9B (sodium/hydrogen exchanger), member 1/2
MAFGIAEILVLCLAADWLLRQLRIPGLVGMLFVGVVLGPYALDLLDDNLLAVGPDLRMIALIVILLRAGFELSRKTLRSVGGRVLLLAFVPATCEALAITLAGPRFLGLTHLQSALLGSVLAAVSPAVVVPSMVRFIKERKGADKHVPSMVMAAASVDDVYVIVAHSVVLGLYVGHDVDWVRQAVGVPISLVLGIGVGLAAGLALFWLFDRFNPRATKRVLLLVAVSALLVRLQYALAPAIPFAALVSTMAIGYLILDKREPMAHEISAKLAKIWVFAEIVLFAMVGAQVNVGVAWHAGLAGAGLIAVGLAARSLGVLLCMVRSPLLLKERLFVVVAYSPKATVQAAIGSAPLLAMRAAGMDTAPGELILAVAVLSILLTAPAGAWAIAALGDRVLSVAPLPDAAYDAAMQSSPSPADD